MLSRVAERIYWTARYLERVESTARLVSIYEKLMFDLPRSVKLSWYNLIIINDLEEAFDNKFSNKDEKNVIKFLLGDKDNLSSIVCSLSALRENVRTTRDVLPEETWELINELSIYVQNNLQQGINRSKRHDFLENVINGCMQINGLLYGSMMHDATWDFLRLGRNIERADMTTRNLEAGVTAIVNLSSDETAINSHQIILGSVLRSLNAIQAFRKHVSVTVSRQAMVEFLIQDSQFPKAISHCLKALTDSASKLPRSKSAIQEINRIQQKSIPEGKPLEFGAPLLETLNDLQLGLASIHQAISEVWFPEFSE